MTTTFKARYKNGKLEPLEPTPFDEDAVIELTAQVIPEESLDERWERLLAEAALPESERTRPFSELLDEVARTPETSQGQGWRGSEEDRAIYAPEECR